MFFVLSKLFSALTFPSNLIGLTALLGLVFLAFRWRKAGGFLLVTAAVLLLVIGWSPIGSLALLALENRFPRPAIEGSVTGIIVLGGQIDTDISQDRQTVALTDAAERLTKTAELSRLHPDARILISGGIGDLLLEQGKSEAALARDLLVEIGVPRERIELEERSRNTCENAVESKVVAKPEPGATWLLVTSAFHMPRAVACFRAAGFSATPYPVDYLVRRSDMKRPAPSISVGLYLADIAAHEWIGLLAYHLAKGTELFPRAYGGHGETVERAEEFAGAFERAPASGKPAIIEVKLDPEAITPTNTLTEIREGR
ncbi:YdcF family protein [Chelativorans xinjiangense]|uniref:YdcF family protein n=1 Tax=Chelativorans xinjiangense TaxID=2681485 RepID=UPI0013596E39|nr:YdcF family protein [Chelativorans xinjiangense]